MSAKFSPLKPLQGEQLRASDPRDLVWLSASAGTGKTHVLSARVMRLLLSGVKPETILCLTYTKAGAAEMADRIHARLAAWVRLDDERLRGELAALGEPTDAAMLRRARRLFARVLDAPGSGLRIQTIHSFCQALLAAFPAEAGLSPGFRPLEGREEKALCRRTLAELLVDAERSGDLGLIRDVEILSLRLGEERAEAYLVRCARAIEAMRDIGPREGIEARVRIGLDLPLGDVEESICAGCTDDGFDVAGLRELLRLNVEWGTGRGADRANAIGDWLAMTGAQRADGLEVLAKAVRATGKGYAPQTDAYQSLAARINEAISTLVGLRARAALAILLAAGLRAGQSFALAYEQAKRSAGLVDFDDLIRRAAALLRSEGMGAWVRYKLDQATDHILVDEAQDTNLRQWAIVDALAQEFFAGEGAKGDLQRTIFTVGDFKQAIFSFQGTDPRAFVTARDLFAGRAAAVERELVGLSLDRSFRSTPPVLELVDRMIETIGADAFGVSEAIEPHVSARAGKPGRVELWWPVGMGADAEVPAGTEGEADDGEEGWIDDATRAFATSLARQIATWLRERLPMPGLGRTLRPEDVLILVRTRGALAALIVARLHAEGVPVAGIDRLRLNAPLAVRDLLAAMRFATQPGDDLSLASLLVSPLFGWDQERLYRVGFGRKASLWQAMRAAPDAAAEAVLLGELLALADYATPHRFFEHILSGPIAGRRKLVSRLGEEVRDPIEELLNAALGFERGATPSFQRFLDWFDRGEVEISRDPAASEDAVRVMTVHGSKGLQAPLVILADATADPGARREDMLDWEVGPDLQVPIIMPRKAEVGSDGDLAAQVEARKGRGLEEHWRLLYVALTRAEEHLVVAGAVGPRAAKNGLSDDSWYSAVERSLETLGATWEEDPIWGRRRLFGGGAPVTASLPPPRRRTRIPWGSEPDWLRRAAPVEARPPRPLAPSSLGLDTVADPPPSPAMAEAARRGTLIHGLFERLPALAVEARREAGLRWLRHSGGLDDAALAAELVDEVCAILADPVFAPLFAPDGLAEAPIAAVVGTEVVAGTVDRLLVTDQRVLLVDYKTGRRVPATPEAAPHHHIVQMAAYVAALEVIFPGRTIEAALLYTAGPSLLALPQALLDREKANLLHGGR